jgi:hypothetical protein
LKILPFGIAIAVIRFCYFNLPSFDTIDLSRCYHLLKGSSDLLDPLRQMFEKFAVEVGRKELLKLGQQSIKVRVSKGPDSPRI